MDSDLVGVASLNVTSALTRPLAANSAGTCTLNGEPLRLASRLPSSVKTTRFISRPRTVAVNPRLHCMSDVGGLVRFRPADPFRVGSVEWLAFGGSPLARVGAFEPPVGGVEPP